MYRYLFHCKKCGFHEECATKDDYSAIKSWHKSKGCALESLPYKGGHLLVRKDLAEAIKRGKEILLEREQLAKQE